MKTKTAGIAATGILSLATLFGNALAANQKPAYLERGSTHADLCVYRTLKEMGRNHFNSITERVPPGMQYKLLQKPLVVDGNTLENIKSSCIKHYEDPEKRDFPWSGDPGGLSYYKDKTSIQISHMEISLLPG